jgi:hypothetical protein
LAAGTEECDHIWRKAQPRLEKSGVSDVITGEQKTSKVRTSSGMFFERAEDEVVARVEERVATVTMLPAGNAEGMQVLHYVVRLAPGADLVETSQARHLNWWGEVVQPPADVLCRQDILH